MSKLTKFKKFIKRLIYNDKYLIICSVITAVIIWIAVSLNLSPLTTKKITVPVSVSLENTVAQQLGIEYYGNDQIFVDITISCKKYIAKDIDADDITAELKTNAVTSVGYHSVPISVNTKDDAEFTVESYYPTSAEGFYDIPQEVSMPIELNYLNKDFTADGYVSGDAILNESSVTIKGPSTYVSNVKRVVADVDLKNDLTKSQIVTLDPVPLDANGKKVAYVAISNTKDSEFTANIPVLQIRNLIPSINFINAPVNVNSFIDISYSVDSIRAGVLESNDSKYLTIGDIDFSKVKKGKNEFKFDVSKLSGVSVLDGTAEVVVTVKVPNDYDFKTINISRRDVKTDGFDGYDINVLNLSSYSITLMGKKEELEDISKSNLTLTLTPVDGNKLSEETKDCYLDVTIKDASNCWVYGQYTAKINVVESQNK